MHDTAAHSQGTELPLPPLVATLCFTHRFFLYLVLLCMILLLVGQSPGLASRHYFGVASTEHSAEYVLTALSRFLTVPDVALQLAFHLCPLLMHTIAFLELAKLELTRVVPMLLVVWLNITAVLAIVGMRMQWHSCLAGMFTVVALDKLGSAWRKRQTAGERWAADAEAGLSSIGMAVAGLLFYWMGAGLGLPLGFEYAGSVFCALCTTTALLLVFKLAPD